MQLYAFDCLALGGDDLCRLPLHLRKGNLAQLLRARAEGRLSHAEKRPEVVMLAKKLRRKLPKGGQKSYSEIAAELFALGHANSNGVAFSKSSIKSMLEG